MGKWKRGVRAESCEVQTEDSVWLGDALTSGQATVLVDAHNADIDALTAERDELQRRLDAVVEYVQQTADLGEVDAHTLAIAEGRTE